MDYILNNLKNVSQLRSNCEVLKLFIHTFVHIGQKKTEVTIIKFLRLFDKCAMSTSENLMKDWIEPNLISKSFSTIHWYHFCV